MPPSADNPLHASYGEVMREELEAAVRAHQAASIPPGVDQRSVTDADMPTASTIGWATLVLAGVPLTDSERAKVLDLATSSFSMVGMMPLETRPYFARLGLITALTAALVATTSAEL